mmetsp:Transcript_12257/g.27806  ORF Transcript_12257/g.27806 Transcript_12257/m.27806 type:complete len:608 (+) Transcript_12257:108-1931(+)
MVGCGVMSWDVDGVQTWLLKLGPSVSKPEVLACFKDNEVDGPTLLDLTADDLRDELGIKRLATRKILFDRVQELQYVEGSRHRKVAIAVQLECSEEDLAANGEPELAQTSTDFVEAVRTWQEDLQKARQVMEDAEFGSQVQAVELNRQWHIDANKEAAQELESHITRACALERVDAQAATAVHAACSAEQVRRALETAQVQAAAAASEAVLSSIPESASGSQSPRDLELLEAGGSEMAVAFLHESESLEHLLPAQDSILRHTEASSASSSSGAAASASAASSHPHPRSSEKSAAAAAGPVGAQKTIKVSRLRKCAACFEMKTDADLHTLQCEHAMCKHCLSRLFLDATQDLTLWPPRCCRQPIDLSIAKHVLSAHQELVFAERVEEAQAVKKMYCVNAHCSHFLNLDMIGTDKLDYACPKCSTALCLACKHAAHPGLTCKEAKNSRKDSAVEQQLQELADKKGWRRCGKCGVMVQLSGGCNHMTCRCGHHFCYACGKAWFRDDGERLCTCDLFEHENLLEEENRQVRNIEAVLRMPVPEVERQHIRERLMVDECHHGDWHHQKFHQKFGHFGLNVECSNCGFFMMHYCYQCGRCNDMVCHTCRFHRL